jgi:hypothetical protein
LITDSKVEVFLVRLLVGFRLLVDRAVESGLEAAVDLDFGVAFGVAFDVALPFSFRPSTFIASASESSTISDSLRLGRIFD